MRKNSKPSVERELELDEIRIAAREKSDGDCERFYHFQKQFAADSAAVVKEVLSERGITLWEDEEEKCPMD